MFLVRESAWQFITSSSGGIGVEFVVAEGGSILLQDPSGQSVSFPYGAAGVGLSVGFKLPKIGKIALNIKGKNATGTVAPASFPNTGKVCVMESFPRPELSRSDITGVCMFVEIGAGAVVGGSATAMIFGMDPLWLAGYVASSAVAPGLALQAEQKMIESATGALVMAGLNAGIQGGAGIGAYLGALI